MTIITGAAGALNDAPVEHLLQRIPTGQVGVSARDVAKERHFADRGVRARRGSYDDPAALPDSFEGAEQVLLVSSGRPLLDLHAAGPLPGRGRRGVRAAVPVPETSPSVTAPAAVELITRLREELARQGWTPGRRPSPGTWSTTTSSRSPRPPSAATWPARDWSPRTWPSGRSRPASGSPPSSPTSAGSPTSPAIPSPTAPIPRS